MESFFSLFIFFLCFTFKIHCDESLIEVKTSGDIIIGGIFPIHEGAEVSYTHGDQEWTCNRLSAARLAQSLIMIHAVEEINKNHELGDLTLGYTIKDTCADVTVALRCIQSFMQGNDKKSPHPVLAVIGEYYSEISVAVTRQLNLENIPEISYGSTSGLLSDKNRFPSFMRTVPEDHHQAGAIVEILNHFGWSWVGVVTTDGEYGRYAVEHLRQQAEKKNICFAFTSILPESFSDNNLHQSIDDAVKNIVQANNATVIVSFARSRHMMYLFDKLLRNPNRSKKLWVASDNWSQSADALNTTAWKLEDIGTVIGTNLKSASTSKFEQFLRNLSLPRPNSNPFLNEFSKDKSDKEVIDELITSTNPFAIFSINLAVKAIAQAIKDLNIDKSNASAVTPLTFRNALRSAVFSMDGINYSFDKKGDIDSGYDVLLWKQSSSSGVDMKNLIGFFDIEKEKLTFNANHRKDLKPLIKIISRCSRSCEPGERKVSGDGQPVCCYQCEECAPNSFSNATDSLTCHLCSPTFFSEEGSSNCSAKSVVYMQWEDKYHIAVLVFTGLGALLCVIVVFIFIAFWNTPVVRSSVGPVSVVLLASLFCTFASVVLFGGIPSKWQCEARQVVFGLSFTLCISCILVKSFKIIMAFEFNPATQRCLEKFYKPFVIIPVCLMGQGLICVLWLYFTPPQVKWKSEITERLMFCEESSPGLFGAMLGYIGFLALICLGLAFKGRKLPECYNDAKFITFSMLIFSIAWVIFGPVYVTVTGKYLPAVEMIVILLSAYGILFCQFFTKCYIILFKKEANTKAKFRENVRGFSLGKDHEENANGIENPEFVMESQLNTSPSDRLTH